MKLLRFLIPKNKRPNIKKLESQLHFVGDTVDQFYALLGPRNWIFHDSLPLNEVAAWLEEAAVPDDVEKRIITYYHDRDILRRLVRLASSHPVMRKRRALLDLAIEDHLTGRYYAVVHVLLSVMDGFVNEFETVRRGLHARGIEELDAADTVVSHHLGLANAHASFRVAKTKTSEEPVYELYRNGIVHGSILNFNNEIVSSKAWNRLFAIADWAAARDRERQAQEPRPTWRELLVKIADTNRQKSANQEWQPSLLSAADPGFATHPAYDTCNQFLEFWRRKNYKGMSELISVSAHRHYPNKMIVQTRKEYASLRACLLWIFGA
jgi:hypothetical protein